MLKTGWTVKRIGSERLPKGPSVSEVPVLIHRCSDEKTLSAAAGHVSRGANGKLARPAAHEYLGFPSLRLGVV